MKPLPLMADRLERRLRDVPDGLQPGEVATWLVQQGVVVPDDGSWRPRRSERELETWCRSRNIRLPELTNRICSVLWDTLKSVEPETRRQSWRFAPEYDQHLLSGRVLLVLTASVTDAEGLHQWDRLSADREIHVGKLMYAKTAPKRARFEALNRISREWEDLDELDRLKYRLTVGIVDAMCPDGLGVE